MCTGVGLHCRVSLNRNSGASLPCAFVQLGVVGLTVDGWIQHLKYFCKFMVCVWELLLYGEQSLELKRGGY